MQLAERFARAAVAAAPDHDAARLALADAIYRQARHADALEVLAASNGGRRPCAHRGGGGAGEVALGSRSPRGGRRHPARRRVDDHRPRVSRLAAGVPRRSAPRSGFPAGEHRARATDRRRPVVRRAHHAVEPQLARARARVLRPVDRRGRGSPAWKRSRPDRGGRVAHAVELGGAGAVGRGLALGRSRGRGGPRRRVPRFGTRARDVERVAGGSMGVGWATLMRGEVATAISRLEDAVALTPSDDRIGIKTIALVGLGWAHAWNGNVPPRPHRSTKQRRRPPWARAGSTRARRSGARGSRRPSATIARPARSSSAPPTTAAGAACFPTPSSRCTAWRASTGRAQ